MFNAGQFPALNIMSKQLYAFETLFSVTIGLFVQYFPNKGILIYLWTKGWMLPFYVGKII